MPLRLLLLCLAWLWLASSAVASSDSDGGKDFDATLAEHLRAIAERDLPALLATVSDRPDFSVIFPGGERIVGKAAYEDFHRKWFEDPNWRMELTELSRWQTGEQAGVLLRYTYRDQPEPGTGNPRDRFLFLLFQRIDGQWLLVHDQNTPVAAGE